MLEIIESKLKEFGVFSSKNYQYLDKSLEELEVMLMEEAALKNFEKCTAIKNEIQKRIKGPKVIKEKVEQ